MRHSVFQEGRRTLALAVPLILGQVGTHLTHVIDMAMIGRVGVVPLAAATFSGSLFGIPLLFCFGFTTALSVLISEKTGARDKVGALDVLRVGLILLFGVGALIAGLMVWLVSQTDWWHLSQPIEVVEASRFYLITLGLSIVPLLLFQCLKCYCEALNRPWLPLILVGLTMGLNVLLNWILIYGNWGAPALGLNGAGIATFLSRFLVLMGFWLYLALSSRWRMRWSPASFFRWDRSQSITLSRLGFPIGLQITFEVAAFNLATFMMGWLPGKEVSIAAHAIALNYAALAFMVPLGMSFANGIRIGQARGENDFQRARDIGLGSFFISLFFMSIIGLSCFLGRDFLPLFFIQADSDPLAPQVLTLASTLLVWAAALAIFDGTQITMGGALRGYRDVRWPTAITFVAYWLICLPVGFVLAFDRGMDHRLPGVLEYLLHAAGGGYGMGPPGVWLGLTTGLALTAAALSIRFHLFSRKPAPSV